MILSRGELFSAKHSKTTKSLRVCQEVSTPVCSEQNLGSAKCSRQAVDTAGRAWGIHVPISCTVEIYDVEHIDVATRAEVQRRLIPVDDDDEYRIWMVASW
jgi:hypothetical protein